MAKTESPDELMARTDHPFKAEIEALRTTILGASGEIAERVKWNAPSYFLSKNSKRDMAAFNLHQQKFVQLVWSRSPIWLSGANTEVKMEVKMGKVKLFF